MRWGGGHLHGQSVDQEEPSSLLLPLSTSLKNVHLEGFTLASLGPGAESVSFLIPSASGKFASALEAWV